MAATLGRVPRTLLIATATACLLCTAGCRNTGLPDYPTGYREFAYVANAAGNTVTVLDLVYLRPDRTLMVGADPTAIAVNPKRNEVYVLNAQPGAGAGSVSVIDTERNSVVATLAVQRGPAAIAVDPAGQRAYVTNAGSGTVSVLDLVARRQVGTVQAGERPGDLAVAPDNRTLVVANAGSGTVSVFGIEASGVRLRATFAGCPGAMSPVILPKSQKVYAACAGGHQVLAVALAARGEVARQDVALAQDHLLTFLNVGREPASLSMKPDGGEIFVLNRGADSVSEIATETNEVGSTFPIGNRPTHGVVSGDNSALWVSASGTDSLSLYSIDDGKFVSSIRTGSAPDSLAFSATQPDGQQHLLLVADAHSGDVAVIRTTSRLGPALLTILPAGGSPAGIGVKAMSGTP